jgi:hypothetical protein
MFNHLTSWTADLNLAAIEADARAKVLIYLLENGLYRV